MTDTRGNAGAEGATGRGLTVCAFCPAQACEGLTVIVACETHWNDPERAAWDLETRAQQAEAELRAARAEIAALRGAGATERAEAAIMSHAEAYRLVQEAIDMRAERDTARAQVAAAERQVRHVERMRDEMVAKRNREIASLKQQRKYLAEHRDDVNGDAQVKARYRALKQRQRNTRAMLDRQVTKTRQQRAKTGRVGNAAYAARIAVLTYEYQNLDQAATIKVVEAQRDMLLAEITAGHYCRLCDGFGDEGEQIVHREDCLTRLSYAHRALLDQPERHAPAGAEEVT